MKRKHHPSARTNQAVRRAIQKSEKSASALAKELGHDRKTVAKWRKRPSTNEMKKGPKNPHAVHLDSASEEFVAFYRLITRLSLDDCMSRLGAVFPKLSRSALGRCFERHGINRIRPELRLRLAERPSSRPPRRYWIAGFGDAENPDRPGLFAAIDEKSFEIFCRRKPLSRLEASDFLLELCDAYPNEVVQATTTKDWLFVAAPTEPRPWLHPFAETCRIRRIGLSSALPSTEALARVLKPDPPEQKLGGADVTRQKLVLIGDRLITLSRRKSNHICPLTMTPWDSYPGGPCPIKRCGGDDLCLFNSKNNSLYE